ncbi:DUF4167 domain-containing protein [Rickettsiales bacterium]|nr:DUF4167 domain-containing protein [Rickettsiales bacterium]
MRDTKLQQQNNSKYSSGGRASGRSNNGRSSNSRSDKNRGAGRPINGKGAFYNKGKYEERAREALASGDRVSAEYFFQHAEHYSRVASSQDSEKVKNKPRQDNKIDLVESKEESSK